MKPCKSCPFNRESLPGMWEAAHYLGIAYLSCADTPRLISARMGCHQWNGIVHPSRQPGDTPLCGGWMRAARESLAIRMAMFSGRADPAEVHDDTPVMTPEEMCRANGFDMDRLPPLKWDPRIHRDRYPTYQDWETEVVELREAIMDDPQVAFEYVLDGSPLALGVTREKVAAAMGEDVACAYYGDPEPQEEAS